MLANTLQQDISLPDVFSIKCLDSLLNLRCILEKNVPDSRSLSIDLLNMNVFFVCYSIEEIFNFMFLHAEG